MKSATSPDTSRLFVALWPDEVLRAELLGCRDSWIWPEKAYLAHADSLHITLHFLGDIATGKIPELTEGLRLPFSAFDLTLDHPQIWTSGVAVLQPQSPPAALQRLHDALGEMLASMAIPVEARRYRPHVTFARRAGGAIIPSSAKTVPWHVRSYALVHSQLTPPRGYRVLQTYRCIS